MLIIDLFVKTGLETLYFTGVIILVIDVLKYNVLRNSFLMIVVIFSLIAFAISLIIGIFAR